MSILKQKSDINLMAAELLHNNSLYPSVVHCSYYSCFQLMKHLWLGKMGKTEEDLKTANNNTTEGSHEVLINKIIAYLKNSTSADSRTFQSNIGQLKKLRKKADYESVQIDVSVSKDSIDLSKATSGILKKCL
jgi:uncharacterized protein (UPF0332 family)